MVMGKGRDIKNIKLISPNTAVLYRSKKLLHWLNNVLFVINFVFINALSISPNDTISNTLFTYRKKLLSIVNVPGPTTMIYLIQ